MKSKGLIFVSCLAAGALVSSPEVAKQTKKSKSNRTIPQTTQVTRNNQTLTLARSAPATITEAVSVGPALTRAANTLGPVTTAAHDITIIIMGPADAITTAVGLTRTTAITRAGRPRAGVTAHPRSITLTRIGAVIPMLVTTTTIRTTRQPPAITRQWLQLCSGGLANSVTT